MAQNDPRLTTILDHAARVLRERAGESLAQAVDTLGLRARMATKVIEREPLLQARLALIEGAAQVMPRFEARLREEMGRLVEAPLGEGTNIQLTSESAWAALTLVDDDEVENDIAVGRLTQLIASAAESELRDLTGCMATLLNTGHHDVARHPLRADVPAVALVDALASSMADGRQRSIVLRESGSAYARDIAAAYGAILTEIRARGVRPVPLSVGRVGSRASPTEPSGSLPSSSGVGFTGPAEPGSGSVVNPGVAGAVPTPRRGSVTPAAPVTSGAPGAGRAQTAAAASTGSEPTDVQRPDAPESFSAPTRNEAWPGVWPMLADGLAMELAPSASAAPYRAGATKPAPRANEVGAGVGLATQKPGKPVSTSSQPPLTGTPTQHQPGRETTQPAEGGLLTPDDPDLLMQALRRMQSRSDAASSSLTVDLALPENLILAHREELHRLAPGGVDARIIDLVSQVFEQILNDARVPPEMAREIARLQLPVLRLTLKDPSFFISRAHPARRLIDRLAALAAAIEDFAQPPGRALLDQGQRIVNAVLDGNFGEAGLFADQLQALERFASEYTRDDLERRAAAPSVLAEKERELRMHRSVRAMLAPGLAAVDAPEFVRTFLADIWSQAMAHAACAAKAARDQREAEPADDEAASIEADGVVYRASPGKTPPDATEQWNLRTQAVASELILSLKPKAGSQDRQRMMAAIPALMRDLREGLRRIGWPAEAPQRFLHLWMPAQAQALKAPPSSDLDHNLLACRLNDLWASALAVVNTTLPGSNPAPSTATHAAGTPAPCVAKPRPEDSLGAGTIHFPVETAQRIGWLPEERMPLAVRTADEVPAPPVVLVGAMAQGPGTVSEPSFAPTRPDGLVDDSTLPMPLGDGHARTLAVSRIEPLADLARQVGIPHAAAVAMPSMPGATSSPGADPHRGPQLADHLQLGVAYDLIVNDRLQRVRLSHRTDGGDFLVFTYGAEQQNLVTMSARMVRRACESGRLQAAEAASLVDRASERLSHRLPAAGTPFGPPPDEPSRAAEVARPGGRAATTLATMKLPAAVLPHEATKRPSPTTAPGPAAQREASAGIGIATTAATAASPAAAVPPAAPPGGHPTDAPRDDAQPADPVRVGPAAPPMTPRPAPGIDRWLARSEPPGAGGGSTARPETPVAQTPARATEPASAAAVSQAPRSPVPGTSGAGVSRWLRNPTSVS